MARCGELQTRSFHGTLPYLTLCPGLRSLETSPLGQLWAHRALPCPCRARRMSERSRTSTAPASTAPPCAPSALLPWGRRARGGARRREVRLPVCRVPVGITWMWSAERPLGSREGHPQASARPGRSPVFTQLPSSLCLGEGGPVSVGPHLLGTHNVSHPRAFAWQRGTGEGIVS